MDFLPVVGSMVAQTIWGGMKPTNTITTHIKLLCSRNVPKISNLHLQSLKHAKCFRKIDLHRLNISQSRRKTVINDIKEF
jgi:hypothetical protein